MRDVIIFTGSAIGSVLALSRALKTVENCRIYVICVNSNNASVLKSSKSITKAFDFVVNGDIEFIAKINKWLNSYFFVEKPIAYFTSDILCLWVDRNRDWFEKLFELCLPSSYIVNTFNYKGLAELEAARMGLLVPKTQVISSNIDINYICVEFNFPVIIKPSSANDKNNIDFKVRVIQDKESFKELTERLLHRKVGLICQEYIPGGDDKAFYYLFYRNTKGEIFDSSGKKEVQNPPSQGIMAVGKSEYINDLIKISRSFINKIDYKGIGGIEYKEYNGNYYFIEMSTRLEGFYYMTELSHVPISKLSYDDLSGNSREVTFINQINGETYIDIISLISARRSQKMFSQLFKELTLALFSRKTHFNILSFKDPLPFLLMLKRIMLK